MIEYKHETLVEDTKSYKSFNHFSLMEYEQSFQELKNEYRDTMGRCKVIEFGNIKSVFKKIVGNVIKERSREHRNVSELNSSCKVEQEHCYCNRTKVKAVTGLKRN